MTERSPQLRRPGGRRWPALAALTALALAAPATAAADEVSVRTVDGAKTSGALSAWSLSGGLRMSVADGSTETIASGEIVEVTRTPDGPQPEAFGHLVLLCDGGRLSGELAEVAEERLVLLHGVLGRFTIPLEDVRAIVAPGARQRLGEALAARQTVRAGADASAAPLEDEFWFANGERIRGTLLEMDEDELRMESDAGVSQTPAEYLQAVALANPPYAPPEGVAAILRLADGSVLRVSRLEWVSETIQAAAPGLGEFSFAASELVSAQVVGGRWQWLDELAPAAYEHHSMTGRARPYAIGRNAVNRPLRLGETVHERGLGLRSASRIVFALGGQYETLTALLGLDDAATPYGDAQLSIRVDGNAVFEAPSLRGGAEPQPLRVDLRGADTLEIVVDYGENADVQDWVNLADAALIRRR